MRYIFRTLNTKGPPAVQAHLVLALSLSLFLSRSRALSLDLNNFLPKITLSTQRSAGVDDIKLKSFSFVSEIDCVYMIFFRCLFLQNVQRRWVDWCATDCRAKITYFVHTKIGSISPKQRTITCNEWWKEKKSTRAN